MPSISVDTRVSLSHIFEHCKQHEWAFASFRFPDAQQPWTYIQTHSRITSIDQIFDEGGFVFSPFDQASQHPALGILPDMIIKGWETIKYTDYFSYHFSSSHQVVRPSSVDRVDRNTYLNRLQNLISLIGQHPSLEKVVISRPIEYHIPYGLDTFEVFHELCERYPQAFVYLFYHPEVGIWIGATPERLIKAHDKHIEIVSLAGTKEIDSSMGWRYKETHEQEIVTQYIKEILKTYQAKQILQQGPYTFHAGSVQHLKTVLRARLDDERKYRQLIDDLHPTPAVCGYPKQLAMDWIRSHEGYDRQYYTGYLGTIHRKSELDLYVNLRCMQVFDDSVVLYVGGGITAESLPVEEWDETQAKSQTLLSVLPDQVYSENSMISFK